MLYIITTPIGNLKDITLRAIETLKEVDYILCEDTRITRKLLSRYDIHKFLISYHKHSPQKIYKKIFDLMASGKKLALVTDSGTPGISDPGGRLINFLLSKEEELKGVSFKIMPIPGPSALTAAVSVSGVEGGFVFLGFPPRKKGREKFFEVLKSYSLPVILYESPHRIKDFLNRLETVFGENKNIIICRELTKIHEEIFRGSIKKADDYLKNETRGEFVIIVP